MSRASPQKSGVDDADGKDKGKGRVPPIVTSPVAGANQVGMEAGSRRGRKVRVGGSELHSSEKEACLM